MAGTKTRKGTKGKATRGSAKGAAKKASKPATRLRPQLDDDGLKTAEKELVAKAKERGLPVRGKKHFIVPGSLWNSKDSRAVKLGFTNKRTVEILCQEKGCDKTRRVATSDLAQVSLCEEHTHARRLEARRRNRQSKSKSAKK